MTDDMAGMDAYPRSNSHTEGSSLPLVTPDSRGFSHSIPSQWTGISSYQLVEGAPTCPTFIKTKY
jgi:hypothetical protein